MSDSHLIITIHTHQLSSVIMYTGAPATDHDLDDCPWLKVSLKECHQTLTVVRQIRFTIAFRHMVAERGMRQPRERIPGRTCEQVVDVRVRQVVEQVLEVPKNSSQDRNLQGTVERNPRSFPWKSGIYCRWRMGVPPVCRLQRGASSPALSRRRILKPMT